MVHCDHASIWHRYRGMAPQSTCTQTHRHKHGTTDKTTNLYLLQCSLRSLGGDNKYNDDDHTSHGSVSVVRTTFKVYGKCKLWPSANQKPLNRSSPNFNGMIMSWTPTTKQNLGSIRPGVFAPHIGEIYTPPCSKFTTLFFGSSARLQASPLDRFLRLIRQMTRFCARKCLLIVKK